MGWFLKNALNAEFWIKVKQLELVWHVGVFPGLAVVGCVVIARLSGSFQVLEWNAFDNFLRLRPNETEDTRVVIVGIDENDIKAVGDYPIPDRELAKMLRILHSYKPRAIGLDIFRDLTTAPSRAELAKIFEDTPNLVGIEMALGSEATLNVKPPPELPPDQVGFADAIIDPDGKLRRSPLASIVSSKAIKYSLPLLLAKIYLRSEGIALEHGSRASAPIRFGSTVLPRFRSNSGGYVGARAGGNQVLLNFRSNQKPFPTISLTDILAGRVKPDLIRDRIVLIGMTAASVNDTFMTSAVKGTLLTAALGDPESLDQYQLIYGVEIQAHTTSQIVNAVLNGRSLLHVWSESWEYLWILVWGLLGIALGLFIQSPWKTLLSIGVASIGLVGICYGLLMLSWWVPVVPALLALCGAGLTTSFFDWESRTLLEQRSLTLKRTYDAVHNGPLQTLAAILRSIDEENLPSDKLRSQLQELNRELRSVYEFMNQAILTGDNLYSQTPINELLYQVYENTLKRNLQNFSTIKSYIPPDFTPLEDCPLTPDQKQGLCIFLENALCNVGQHAIGASCLDVVCTRENDWYILRIIDNGTNSPSQSKHFNSGRGTDQAKELARNLRGKFQRRPHLPQGTICELTWPAAKPWWQMR